jgi:hypothetical protein
LTIKVLIVAVIENPDLFLRYVNTKNQYSRIPHFQQEFAL